MGRHEEMHGTTQQWVVEQWRGGMTENEWILFFSFVSAVLSTVLYCGEVEWSGGRPADLVDHPAAFFYFSIGSIIAYMRNGWNEWKSIGSIIEWGWGGRSHPAAFFDFWLFCQSQVLSVPKKPEFSKFELFGSAPRSSGLKNRNFRNLSFLRGFY